MTYNELISKILGVDVLLSCDSLQVECGSYCKDCQYTHFGNQEADLAKIYANISVMGLGKALLNSMYGKTVSYKDTDSFPMNKPIEDEWTEVPASLIADNILSIGEILNDATVHGLDFKYENGKYYFKDCHPVHN